MNFEGLIIPTRKVSSFQCAGCPKLIFLHNEIGRKLHKVDGKPYCVTCRIFRTSKFTKQIKNNKGAFEKDRKDLYTLSQQKADQLVEDIAMVTQSYEKENNNNQN